MGRFGVDMKKTTVVNLRLEKCDVKIGRGKDGLIPPPPQEGCFGNPFFLRNQDDEVERKRVVMQYKSYFEKRILEDKQFRDAVLSLKGKKLGCFCKQPDKDVLCHGDVIAKWLNEQEEG